MTNNRKKPIDPKPAEPISNFCMSQSQLIQAIQFGYAVIVSEQQLSNCLTAKPVGLDWAFSHLTDCYVVWIGRAAKPKDLSVRHQFKRWTTAEGLCQNQLIKSDGSILIPEGRRIGGLVLKLSAEELSSAFSDLSTHNQDLDTEWTVVTSVDWLEYTLCSVLSVTDDKFHFINGWASKEEYYQTLIEVLQALSETCNKASRP